MDVSAFGNKANKIYNKSLILFKSMVTENVISKPYQTVYVPVETISNQVWKFKSKSLWQLLFKDVEKSGLILDGDWDIYKRDINCLSCFKAFRERFLEGKPWEETIYYNKFMESMISKGAGRGGSKSWSEFKELHLNKWDALYEDIRDNGYKSQKEINGRPEVEIRVGVSRDGELLFIDGRHRLAIANILNIEEMPVVVKVWHRDFIEYIKQNRKIRKVTPQTVIDQIFL